VQDRLGGRALGRAAYRAVVDAELGLGLPTRLTDDLLAFHQQDSASGLLHAFTRRSHPLPDSAHTQAARVVLRVADQGDAVALGIVRDQASWFARYAAVAAHEVGLDHDPRPSCLILGGSVMASEHAVFRDAVVAALSPSLGQPVVRCESSAPVMGTLLDAFAEDGVEVTDAVRRTLASHPVFLASLLTT
jgi:N-acetylglucosamine kinase-like BadF-type ATPase